MRKVKMFFHALAILLLSVSNASVAGVPQFILNDMYISDFIEAGIHIKAPNIAENGAVVPITIKRIDVGNQNAYVTDVYVYSDSRKKIIERMVLGASIIPEDLTSRIKLGKTSTIYVIAKLSDGRVLSGEHVVKVTNGGCGHGSSQFQATPL